MRLAGGADTSGMKTVALPAVRGAGFLAAGMFLGLVALALGAATLGLIAGDFLYGVRFALLLVGADFHPMGMTGGIVESFVASMVLSFASYWAWMGTALAGGGAASAFDAWWNEK
jgi:hypothetical protein